MGYSEMKKIMFKTEKNISSDKEKFRHIKSIFGSEVVKVFALSLLITSPVMAIICIVDFLLWRI